MAKELNRKTTIPVKEAAPIVEWLIKNCSKEEIMFMADLASKRSSFSLLNSIFTRLTDYNVYTLFYETVSNEAELALMRASKRGEVAGLKAFAMACQAARAEVERRKEQP